MNRTFILSFSVASHISFTLYILVKWCLDNSISSHLSKPVLLQDLASALASALESSTISPAVTKGDTTFDILLAEDNEVNQRLATQILQKYGHTVEIAENGSVAVDKFKARSQKCKPFDIVLVRLRLRSNSTALPPLMII